MSKARTVTRTKRQAKKATPRKKLRAATAKRAAKIAIPRMSDDYIEFALALREAQQFAPNIADGYR